MFEFELARVEDIAPWGEPGKLRLSWFALTDGRFRIVLGDQVLFRYTDAILSYWGYSERDAGYQLADLARDILGSFAAAVTPLPPRIERLASNWELLTELIEPLEDDSESSRDLEYAAWRWLYERSPSTCYFTEYPRFQFVRIGENVHIHWDNRDRRIDGVPVWTAQYGKYVIPLEKFVDDCRTFSARLLSEMDERIAGIAAGRLRPQVEVDVQSLRIDHETWRNEFESYFRDHYRDFTWEESERALAEIAERKGMQI
jgi:hypothetical protein